MSKALTRNLPLILLALVGLIAVLSPAVADVSRTDLFRPADLKNPVQLVTLAWNGNGTYTTDATSATLTFNGTLLQVAFKPDSGGTQPTDLHDLTLTNVAGVDVLGGLGANLSNATATQETPLTANGLPYILAGNHTLVVANSGSGKGGTLYLWMR